MLVERTLIPEITEKLNNGRKIVIIYGPRQVGKTTLVNQFLANYSGKFLSINADEQKYIDTLSSRDLNKIKLLVAGYDLVFIDEAQRIPNIGVNLKIMHDNLSNLKIIVTGSSSLELANQIKEPLTGRTWTYNLYPLSILELSSVFNDFELNDRIEQYLVFGQYPELFSIENQNDRNQYLAELSSSYLYKDILDIASIKHPTKFQDLLKLLSFQIGNQVSTTELATSLKISRETAESYINLLEKAFIIFRLPGFSRNLRKEVTKMDKIYFYDLGIRNILINNLNPLSLRNDVGQLWENFLIAERIKFNSYSRVLYNKYFWRLYTGSEIDYIEETQGKLFGYEFKHNNKFVKSPKSWTETYPDAEFKTINKDNFFDFIR